MPLMRSYSRQTHAHEQAGLVQRLGLRHHENVSLAEHRRSYRLIIVAVAFGIPAFCLHLERRQFKARLWKGRRREVWDSAETLFIRGLDALPSVDDTYQAAQSTLLTKRALHSTPELSEDNARTAKLLMKDVSSEASAASNGSRVALCIVGHARSFHLPSVHISIIRNLLRPLAANSTTLDIFFHIGLHDIAKNSSETASTAESETRKAANIMKPVVLSIYNDSMLDLNANMHLACPQDLQHACTAYPPALLRASQCMALVQSHELKNSIRYDWIVKTRPDIAFGDPVAPITRLQQDRVYINEHIPGTSTPAFTTIRELYSQNAAKFLNKPFADHIAMVPRKLADTFFSSHLAAGECLNRVQKSRLVNAETIMGMWLIKHAIRYETLPWFWILVRDRRGPECSRLRWVGRFDNKTADFAERCQIYNQTGFIPAMPDTQ